MFGRATIRLGIGPHSSLFLFCFCFATCCYASLECCAPRFFLHVDAVCYGDLAHNSFTYLLRRGRRMFIMTSGGLKSGQ